MQQQNFTLSVTHRFQSERLRGVPKPLNRHREILPVTTGQSGANTADGFGYMWSPEQGSSTPGEHPEGQGTKPNKDQREGLWASSTTGMSLARMTSGRLKRTSRKDCLGQVKVFSALIIEIPKISVQIRGGKEHPHTTNLSQLHPVADSLTPMQRTRRECRVVEIDCDPSQGVHFDFN